MVTDVDDDESQARGAAGAGGAGGDAGSKLLEEQQARIAALRFAVLSGRVPDEESFDYARFFGGSAEDDAPSGVPDDAAGVVPDGAAKG